MMNNTSIDAKANNLIEFIEKSFEKFGDNRAFHGLGQTLTFNDVNKQSLALASWLQANTELKPGDRIAIQLPNIVQFPIAAFAALRAGLVLVNTNPMYTSREMLHQFNDSGAKALIILDSLQPNLQAIIDQTLLEVVILASATRKVNSDLSTQVNTFCLEEIIQQGLSLTFKSVQSVQPDDVCVLQYTGGTTGVAKGAKLTHHSILSNILQVGERFSTTFPTGGEVLICPLPLYHIYAFVLHLFLGVSKGVLNVLIANPRDLDSFVNTIKPFKLNAFAGLNTLFVGLCQHPEFRSLDFSKLKLTISGGTALTPATIKSWKEVTHCEITEGYGLSETSPVVCLNQPGNENYGTVGLPLTGYEVKIRNEQGEEVAQGESGEIVTRGPHVMTGYWNKPEETAKVMTKDGFFKTGDIGMVLPDGCIQIVDRLKDMIIVSGFNVYPNEIEAVLVEHPNILEAAVIGVPDNKTGEKVTCYITVNTKLTFEEVYEHCRQYLTAYKVPKDINIVEELPKSSVGKILRRELRAV